jgi:hypothetical protein
MNISPNEVGSMVFQSINAAGELVNTRSISKNELSDDQLEAITNLLYHRLSTGEKKIMVKGKEFTIAGNLESGRGIVDSLILLADRNKAEKQLFFKKNGSLVVGKKEYTFKDDEKEIKAAIMDTLRKGNSEANFKTNVVGDSEFVLPTINEEGEFEGEITTYNDYLFKGDNPLIGTFVNKDVPFINSYYGFEMDGNGYKTNSIKEVPETPIYPPVNIPSIDITPTEPVLPKTEYTGWKVIKDVINDSYSVENPQFPDKGSMFIDTIEEANKIAAELNAEETNKVVKPVAPVAPVINTDNIKGKQNINGVKEIRFNNPNFKLENFEINGNYWSVITSTDRAKVLVNINGTIVPFYLTTNQAGKNLIPGWYPFFGIGKDGWLNKTDKSDMETYYERYWGKEAADIVKSAAEELNAFYGTDSKAFKNDGDPNEKVRPLSTLADKAEDYINSKLSYTPAINDANARTVLRSNAEQLGKEIIAKYDKTEPALESKTEIGNRLGQKLMDEYREELKKASISETAVELGLKGLFGADLETATKIKERLEEKYKKLYDEELAASESPFKETPEQSPEVTELKEKIEEKAEESIKDCNSGGIDLSGKASKYRKK